MEEKQSGFPVNSIRICIDEEDDEIRGRICGVGLKKEIAFSSRNELVIKIDEAFDAIGQPQPHQVIRSFKNDNKDAYISYEGSPKRYRTSEVIQGICGTKRTVDFIMTSRKRAEWQGLLKDTNGKLLGRFNSTLECMKWL